MAMGALYQIVQGQADMMAYDDVFWTMTVFIIAHPADRVSAQAHTARARACAWR